jgi:5-methylcytosine-specific restriction protein A
MRMATYLLVWNSLPENWDDYDSCLDSLSSNQPARRKKLNLVDWRLGLNRTVRVNDRVFFLKIGIRSNNPPYGIVGSGWVTSRNDDQDRLTCSIDALIDYRTQDILTLDQLKSAHFIGMDRLKSWTPQQSVAFFPPANSGLSPEERIEEENRLEELWMDHLKTLGMPATALTDIDYTHDEEPEGIEEGRSRTVTANVFERSQSARRECIEFNRSLNKGKIMCACCGFDFSKTYGELGEGFIHVHHIEALYEHGGVHEVDPKTDMIPVCPNCHSMLHRNRDRTLKPEELREIIAANKTSP